MKTAHSNNFKKTVVIMAFLITIFVAILMLFDFTTDQIKESKKQAVEQARDRDFELIWDYLISLSYLADDQACNLATRIETTLKETFNLDELETALQAKDPETMVKVHDIVANAITGEYFGGVVENNRNAVMVLEGYDTIIEDLFIDENSREKCKTLETTSDSVRLSDYKATTYNLDLFNSAIRKMRTQSDLPIAMEPYNYIVGDHEIIHEMNHENLKRVYINEGIEGLRNYQFLAPAYITKSGDIFGKKDIVGGRRQETHKFIVIQFFNLYDQLMHVDSNFETNQYASIVEGRYDSILNILNILGILITCSIFSVILFFLMLYNNMIARLEEEGNS